jgi:hypothetical protein
LPATKHVTDFQHFGAIWWDFEGELCFLTVIRQSVPESSFVDLKLGHFVATFGHVLN